MVKANHGFEAEGPDANDAPPPLIKELRTAHELAMARLGAGTLQAAQKAFKKLVALSNRCSAAAVCDPAFSDVFRDLAIVAGRLGEAGLALEAYGMALELAAAREPFSVITCVLALRMLHLAHLAAEEVDDETRQGLRKLAREHFSVVFGT